MAKKETDAKETKHSKEKLLKSKRYAAKKDLVSALLDDNNDYTIQEVDVMIEKYLKGKVV